MKKIVLGLAVLGVAGMVGNVDGMQGLSRAEMRRMARAGKTVAQAPVSSFYGDVVEGGSSLTFEPSSVVGEGIKIEPTASATPATPETSAGSATKKEKAPKIERTSSFYKSEHIYYITNGDTLESFIKRHEGDFENEKQAEYVFNKLQADGSSAVTRKKIDALLTEAKEKFPNKVVASPEASSAKDSPKLNEVQDKLTVAEKKLEDAEKALDATRARIAELEAETKKVIATLTEKEAEVEKLKIALLEGNLIFRNPDELFRALTLLRIFNSTEEAIKAANILEIFRNEQQALDAILLINAVKDQAELNLKLIEKIKEY